MNTECELKLKKIQYQISEHKQNVNFFQSNEMDTYFENNRKLTDKKQNIDFINAVQKILSLQWQNDQFKASNLVKYLNIKQSTINRQFQMLFGSTAAEFVKDYRLTNACNMLLNPTINISETGYLCGFSDPKYFSRCFRKKYGINPRAYREKFICKNSSKSIQEEMFLEKAMELLKTKNDYSPISFDCFANELNMSKTTLYRRIKNITGQSPCEFIRRYRLSKSVDMLKSSNNKIKDIASTVGFNDSRHFCRCFTNEFGISPFNYRRKCNYC
jgi:AraC-like DNA-binding protein